jgi:hypothetical protein
MPNNARRGAASYWWAFIPFAAGLVVFPVRAAPSACEFLNSVKRAANQVADAVEQAPRASVFNDTVTIHTSRQDYRAIRKYLAKGAFSPDHGADANANVGILLQSVTLSPDKQSSPFGERTATLFMQFTNDSGFCLPQRFSVTVPGGVVVQKELPVRFVESGAGRSVRFWAGISNVPSHAAAVEQPGKTTNAFQSTGRDKNVFANPAADTASQAPGLLAAAVAASVGNVNSTPAAQPVAPFSQVGQTFPVQTDNPSPTPIIPNTHDGPGAQQNSFADYAPHEISTSSLSGLSASVKNSDKPQTNQAPHFLPLNLPKSSR